VILATAITHSIAVVIGVVLLVAWALYLLFNVLRSRAEVGSELELAPNRKPYYSDDFLEGKKLERTQLFAVGLLAIVAIGLPLYWIHEPGRQAAAIAGYNQRFAYWGSLDFQTTANGGFNCAGCHGGMKAVGGSAPYTITDPLTGAVVPVTWNAPALNTVLSRFSVDEVTYIITYGRPFSPMSPWGILGGGPMNDQQISDLIAYLQSIQIPLSPGQSVGDIPKLVQDQVTSGLAAARAANPGVSDGQLLFNLSVASGAYSCARCHTRGWSYGQPQQSGGGAMGPNLTGGSTVRQFPSESDQIAFVSAGSDQGKKYGAQGQGTGRMPGFGSLLTQDQIKAIVDYERNL
jgi:mono/diheme cytochrome c family protein